MFVQSYIFSEAKALFPNYSNSAFRTLLLENKVKFWRPGEGEHNRSNHAKLYLYDKLHIDFLLNPCIELPKGASFKRYCLDIVPIQFKSGDKVSFWEGSYKWDGTVKGVMENDTYKVFNSQIGNHNKRWFELALIR